MQPSLLPALFQNPKKVIGRPIWQATDSTHLRLTCALEVNGMTVEGLELRGGALQTRPDRAVSFHLQLYPAKGPCTPLTRVDWNPLTTHTNPNVGNLPMLRINGSHIHSFDLNWLPEFGRMRSGNLPVARPVNANPRTYEELLVLVGKECRINGLCRVEAPPWRIGDLFGK